MIDRRRYGGAADQQGLWQCEGLGRPAERGLPDPLPQHSTGPLGGGMSKLSQDEIDQLNHRAFGALMGFSSDWKTPLVELLRSSAPISSAVRDTLANAIEGTHTAGLSLKLSGHQAQSKRIEGMLVRRTWLQEGRSVKPFVDPAANVQEGFEAAALAMGKDDSHWRKRYYYANNCELWTKSAPIEGKFYSKYPQYYLEDIWHISSYDQKNDINPNPTTGPDYDRIMKSRPRFLQSVVEQSSHPFSPESATLFVSAMMAYTDLAPPENG